jgi:hypothetical protein
VTVCSDDERGGPCCASSPSSPSSLADGSRRPLCKVDYRRTICSKTLEEDEGLTCVHVLSRCGGKALDVNGMAGESCTGVEMGGTWPRRLDGGDRESSCAAMFRQTCHLLPAQSGHMCERCARGQGVARGWIVLRGISSRTLSRGDCCFHNYRREDSVVGRVLSQHDTCTPMTGCAGCASRRLLEHLGTCTNKLHPPEACLPARSLPLPGDDSLI